MTVLSIKMFGNPTVSIDGRTVVLPYRKADALLYYLVLKRRVPRSELVGMLWADTDAAAALKNLRHAIYTIRKNLECDFFIPGQRTVLEINPDIQIQCDVLDFLENGVLQAYQGEFLENFSIPSASLYEEWLTEQRNLLQSLYLKKLLEAEQAAFAAGDLAAAEQYGLKYVEFDPLEENAAVTLMEVYSAQKKYRKAIGIYHDLCKNLSDELSISPMKETTALYYRIVNEWNSSTYRLEEQSHHLLVGKDLALRKLLTLCNGHAADHRANCVLIEREAGVGKTYLLDHILNHYDFSDHLICRSWCYQSEMNTPLAPWNSIMMALSSEIATHHLPVPENYLKTATKLFPCLSATSGQGPVDSDVDYPFQINYHAAIESALMILALVSKRVRLLLVFEDIHWLDKSSCSMLAMFLRRLRNINAVVICTGRNIQPDYIKEFVDSAQRDNIMERYRIQHFTLEETTQFIHYYMGKNLPDDSVNLIQQGTGGNALLLVHLINSIQESKDLQNLPNDLESIIGYRLANLPLKERQVLDLISVFTEWADFDALSSILAEGPIDLMYLCNQLRQQMLVVESTRDGVLCYALAHERIKSILAQQQSETAHRLLHLRVAQYFERQTDHIRARNYDRLIYHYCAGGNRLKAFQYRVLSLNAYTGLCYALLPMLYESPGPAQPEAESLPSHFLSLERDLSELRGVSDDQSLLDQLELVLLHAKSRYCIYSGLYPVGLDALDRLIQLCQDINDTNMLIRVHLQYIYYGIQIFSPQIMEEHLAVGFQLLAGQEQSAKYGIYLRLSGLRHLMLGNYPKARNLLQDSIHTLQEILSSKDGRYVINIAGCYNYIGESYRLEGRYDEAFPYYDQAIIYNRSYGYYPGAAVFYTNYGVTAFQKGELQAARQMFTYAVQIYHSSHEYSGYPIALSYLARYEADEGNYDAAVENIREAHRISDMIGSPWWKGVTIYNSWKIRQSLNRKHLMIPQLEALWPSSIREHCTWALDFLRKIQPTIERAELESELTQLEGD